MPHALHTALRSDLALLPHEDHVILQAQQLFQEGISYRHISPTQMAALGEIILTTASFADAKGEVKKFLQEQLKKLRAKEERSGQRTSWLVTPKTTTSEATLGELVIQWMTQEQYLPAQVLPELDRLQTLQRFWRRLHGLYRYEAAMEEAMKLVNFEAQETCTP